MRLLHLSKVVFFALFLLLVPVATATAEPAEAVAAPAFFSDLTALIGHWVASVFASETPAGAEACQIFPPGGFNSTGDQADAAACQVLPPHGLASMETGDEPEACQTYPPGG